MKDQNLTATSNEEQNSIIQTETVLQLLDPQGDLVSKFKDQYQGLIITDAHDKSQIKFLAMAL